MAIRREQNPVLPAVILVLFLALLVFLLVSRKRETGASHPQPAETCRIDGVDRSEGVWAPSDKLKTFAAKTSDTAEPMTEILLDSRSIGSTGFQWRSSVAFAFQKASTSISRLYGDLW